MALIDNVLTVGEEAGVQCLQFVTDVTHVATSEGGTAFNSAADLAGYAKHTGILHSVPQLGDIAVWNAGVNGAAGAGHAGIVTGLSNGVQVTSTNWPGGQGATQYTVGVGNNPVGMGLPSGYINPNAIGGKNIITGATGGGITATLTSATSGGSSGSSDCQSLSDVFSESGVSATLGNIPVLGAAWKAASAPEKFIAWGVQPCKRWMFALALLGLVAGGIGLYLVFRREIDSGMSTVAKAVPV